MKRDYEGRLMRNKSFTYILPMLSLYFDIKRENLINTFLYSEDKPKLKNHLFLLYKFSGQQAFLQYEDYLENEELFELGYDKSANPIIRLFKP